MYSVAQTMRHSQWISFLALLIGLISRTGPAHADGVTVTIQEIDGTIKEGQWVGSPDGNSITIQNNKGENTLLRNAIQEVQFTINESQETASATTIQQGSRIGSTVIYLANGGRLFALLSDSPGSGDAISCHSLVGSPLTIPFEQLAGVQLATAASFPKAHEAFSESLKIRPPGHDLLVSRDLENVKKIQGRLEQLGPDGGQFYFGGQSRNFKSDKIYGIIMAAVPLDPSTHDRSMMIELIDGSMIRGILESASDQTLKITTSMGGASDLPLGKIKRFTLRSDRVVELSSLDPVAQQVAGLVHRPWPVRRNRNTAGGPLVLAGRSYESGLGVHARSELTYTLNGQYETFVSTIGLDDSVRPRGNVTFVVKNGEQVLFDSGPVTGGDDPRHIRVDVAGMDQLTLLVDFGEGLDVADQANWANARLIKPAG